MVEHIFPAVGLLIFGGLLIIFLSHPVALIGGFALVVYGMYSLSHNHLLTKHHK